MASVVAVVLSLPRQPKVDMQTALVIALVALLLHPVSAQDAKDSVVGLWLGEMRTQAGLGNWIDFHADGTVEVGSGALVGALLDDTYTGQTAFETPWPAIQFLISLLCNCEQIGWQHPSSLRP
jgi:hypothetical protein